MIKAVVFDLDDTLISERQYILSGFNVISREIAKRYNLYDKDNNIIGVATTYLERLKPGNTWKFTAEYTGPNAKNITHFDINKLDLDEDTWD